MTLDSYNFSKKYDCIWLAPPRTGTRGLSKIFHFLGFQHKMEPLNTEKGMNYTHDYPSEDLISNHKVIISVRNPYSRMFSMYKNYFRNSNSDNFKNYVMNLDGSIVKHPAFKIMDIQSNYVIRLENQMEDLMKVPFISENISEKQIKLFTEHGKKIHNWEDEYDEEMKNKVYNLFHKHFETYNYEK